MRIKHLTHNDIDTKKWDNCISNAVNGNVYAWSWYLDIVSPNWDALVLDNYRAVMPLTWSKKYGIIYIYQPFFTQQLGLFSGDVITEEMLSLFIEAIPAKYRFIELSMNVDVSSVCNMHVFGIGSTTHLKLNNPFEELRKSYNTNTLRNLKKAESLQLKYANHKNPIEIIDLFAANKGQELKELKQKHYKVLASLIKYFIKHEIADFPAVYDNSGNICAAGVFVRSHQKFVFLFGVSTTQGKDMRAMFLLMDRFIRTHSESSMTLDFEGSNVPGVSRFYKGFGGVEYKYKRIKINRLPMVLRAFKH
jgi:hypothetical protein